MTGRLKSACPGLRKAAWVCLFDICGAHNLFDAGAIILDALAPILCKGWLYYDLIAMRT